MGKLYLLINTDTCLCHSKLSNFKKIRILIIDDVTKLLTQVRRISGVQPILGAINSIADH